MGNSMLYLDQQLTDAPPEDPTTDPIQLKRARLILEKPNCAMGELFDFIGDDVDSGCTRRSAESEQSTRKDLEPMRDLSHRLNIIEKESLFVAYRKGFLIPFVHLSSIDFLAASCDVFLDPERPHTTNKKSLRLIPQSLFYAILAHGAAFVKQPELARTLYASVNKMLLQEFATLTRRQATKVPLHIVQVMVHQAIFALSFGEPSLESDSERLMRSLVALFRDSETTDQFLGFDVSTAKDCLKPRTYWIQQEEAKRAFYATFWFISASTLRLNHAPIIRLSDIKAELPCSEVLWEASLSEDFDIASQEHNGWSEFSELYASIIEPQKDCHTSKPASASDTATTLEYEDAENSTDAGLLSEFRFLILVAALHSEVWTWYLQYSSLEIFAGRDERARKLQSAVHRLRGMSPTYRNLVPGSERYKHLMNAVNVLDDTQLMLRIDLTAMKEVLLSRQFEKLNTDTVPNLAGLPESTMLAGIRESATDNGMLVFSELENSFRMNLKQPELDAAAVFSATALVSSAQTGKWWHSTGSWDLHLPSAIMAFSFIQILINWALSRKEAMDCHFNSVTPTILGQLAQGLDVRVSFLSGKYFASTVPQGSS